MATPGGGWRLGGAVMVAGGVVVGVAGAMSPPPDNVGGLVFGGVLVAAGLVTLRRRAPRDGG